MREIAIAFSVFGETLLRRAPSDVTKTLFELTGSVKSSIDEAVTFAKTVQCLSRRVVLGTCT